MLKVWLPLNGNLDNLGLDNPTITSNNIEYSDGGKITNQVAKFNGDCSQYIRIGEAGDYQYQYFTWSLWFSNTDGNDYQSIVSNGRDYAYYGCNLFIHNGHLLLITEAAYTELSEINTWTWYHLALTYDRGRVTIYLNGELVESFYNGWNARYDCSEGLVLGKMSYEHVNTNCYFPFKGYINDFRLYDTALSPREIKELSKGLCVHFPLNDIHNTSSINKYSGTEFDGQGICGSYFTCSKLENERGYNYKMSYWGTGLDCWPCIQFSTFDFKPGQIYYYSCDVRCRSKNFAFYLRASKFNNDWGTDCADILEYDDGEWHRFQAEVTMPVESTSELGGSVYTVNPLFEIWTESLNKPNFEYVCDFDLKNVQVTEGVPNATTNSKAEYTTTVYDTSGYGNHGVLNGTAVSAPNSPRYDTCIGFKDTSSKITFSIPTNLPKFTICNYGKKNKEDKIGSMMWGGTMTYPLNLYFKNDTTLCWNTNDDVNNAFVKDGNPVKITLDNTWHHYAVTGDGTEAKLYIDGVYMGVAPEYKYFSKSDFCISGYLCNDEYAWKDGFLSDFRIYATALSEKEIKEFCNSPMTLTCESSLLTFGEFKEE